MSRRRAPRALAVVAALVALAVVPAAASAKVGTGPAGDAFYTPPSPLPGKAHGDLVWARPLTGGAAVVPGAAKTWLVLYRSQGTGGPAVPVSGVVSIPRGKAPKDGWPVVTYAHGTTGIADQCAPSRDVAGTPVRPYNNYVFGLLTRWLKAGYAVVRTDYEGLGTPGAHPYLVGTSEGRGVLDIVRAARQADPRISKDVAIVGHSQGGHAALWAASLAPKYTPDLRVKGTVALAPASHLDEQIPVTTVLTNPGGGLSGLIAMIIRGAATADPSLDLGALLSPQAAALYPRTLDACLPELGSNDLFGALSPAGLFVDKPDFTAAAKDLDAQDPSHLKITTPLVIEQGTADTTVLPLFTDALDRDLRANGVKLTYKKYPGVDHGGIVLTPKPQNDAYTYVKKRLGQR
jgi:pimeloyl-ACP methyl ester carboxylesterase